MTRMRARIRRTRPRTHTRPLLMTTMTRWTRTFFLTMSMMLRNMMMLIMLHVMLMFIMFMLMMVMVMTVMMIVGTMVMLKMFHNIFIT